MKNFSTSTHISLADNAAKKIVEYAKRNSVDLIVMDSRSTAPKNRIKGMLWFPLGSVLEMCRKWRLVLFSLLGRYSVNL